MRPHEYRNLPEMREIGVENTLSCCCVSLTQHAALHVRLLMNDSVLTLCASALHITLSLSLFLPTLSSAARRRRRRQRPRVNAKLAALEGKTESERKEASPLEEDPWFRRAHDLQSE